MEILTEETLVPDPPIQVAEFLCPECGERIHVADPRALLLALHLVNSCPEARAVIGDHE